MAAMDVSLYFRFGRGRGYLLVVECRWWFFGTVCEGVVEDCIMCVEIHAVINRFIASYTTRGMMLSCCCCSQRGLLNNSNATERSYRQVNTIPR